MKFSCFTLLEEETMEENNTEVLYQEEEGATMVEYVLLIVLIAILAIAAIQFAGQSVSQRFSNVGSTVAP